MLNVLTHFAAACTPANSFLGFPTWYQYLDSETIAGKCTPKINTDVDGVMAFLPILLALVEIMLRLAGLLAIGFIIHGGFRMITSQGEPDRVKDARSTMINALVGLIIAITATGVITFIGRSLIK